MSDYDGGAAYPITQGYYAERGMSYHDVMVKDFMAQWFAHSLRDANIFADALLGEQSMRDAIMRAKRLADLIVQMKPL